MGTPMVHEIIENVEIIKNKKTFLLILQARILISIIGNLDMALQGLGDIEYATEQLATYEVLLSEIEEYNKY